MVSKTEEMKLKVIYIRIAKYRQRGKSSFPGGSEGKESAWVRKITDHLEEGMTTCSSILAWRIPRTEERGGLQSMGS